MPVVSGHNQWYLWGTRGYSGNVVIDVSGDCGAKHHIFDHVERAATFTNRWAIGDEIGIPIMVCRGIHQPLSALWPAFKEYI